MNVSLRGRAASRGPAAPSRQTAGGGCCGIDPCWRWRLLLLLLTALVDVLSPGSVTPDWVVATLVFAAPLGIIAAGTDPGDSYRRHRPFGRHSRHGKPIHHGDRRASRRRHRDSAGSWGRRFHRPVEWARHRRIPSAAIDHDPWNVSRR